MPKKGHPRWPRCRIPRPSAGSARTPGGPGEAVVSGEGTLATLFRIAADDVTLDGLEVTAGGGDLIDCPAADPPRQRTTIRYSIVHGSSGGAGVQLAGAAATMEHNHVFATAGDGLSLSGGSGGTIRANDVHHVATPGAAIHAYGASDTTIHSNLVYQVPAGDSIRLGSQDGSDAAGASEIVLCYYYPPDADQASLGLWWWSGSAWLRCAEQGIEPAGGEGCGGYLWARITAASTPSLADLSGSPFAAGSPALSLEKVDDADPVPATWRVRYRITVHNTAGADVEGVVVTDTLPAGTYFVWADQGGLSANGRVTWSLGTLPAGEARTLRLDVSSFSSVRGEITNQQVTAAQGRQKPPFDAAPPAAIILPAIPCPLKPPKETAPCTRPLGRGARSPPRWSPGRRCWPWPWRPPPSTRRRSAWPSSTTTPPATFAGWRACRCPSSSPPRPATAFTGR